MMPNLVKERTVRVCVVCFTPCITRRTGAVYTIANPEKVRAFDGQEVMVTGTRERKKLTITEINPAGTGADAAPSSH